MIAVAVVRLPPVAERFMGLSRLAWLGMVASASFDFAD